MVRFPVHTQAQTGYSDHSSPSSMTTAPPQAELTETTGGFRETLPSNPGGHRCTLPGLTDAHMQPQTTGSRLQLTSQSSMGELEHHCHQFIANDGDKGPILQHVEEQNRKELRDSVPSLWLVQVEAGS